jgi:hypothetical protein
LSTSAASVALTPTQAPPITTTNPITEIKIDTRCGSQRSSNAITQVSSQATIDAASTQASGRLAAWNSAITTPAVTIAPMTSSVDPAVSRTRNASPAGRLGLPSLVTGATVVR